MRSEERQYTLQEGYKDVIKFSMLCIF